MGQRIAAAALLATLVLAGCSQSAPAAPGNPAAYDRINALTDCAALQAEFDTASSNFDRAEKGTAASAAALGFMQAADARMKQVNCY